MAALFSKYYNFFFLIVTFIYNIFPKKIRPIILLLVSLTFFYLMSSKLIICLLLTILSIYLSALLVSKIEKKKKVVLENAKKDDKKQIKLNYLRKKRLVLLACVLFNFAFLFVFKYLKFFTINTNYILELLRFERQFSVLKLVAPIGVSFYTMQALSYFFDVYNGKIEAEKNFFKVALFVSFFPQIMEGPMARYSDTADDLYKGEKITYDNFCYGMERIIWGIFKKMVIADRLNVLVNTIFDNYLMYSGPICFLGALGYTIMLYMEFSSTMDIVIGTGRILGVKMPENFKQPFFSKNISEFWTRWHITLGAFFRDYIFYPLSLSKPMKKLTINARKYVGNYFGPMISGTIALFAVWFLNGLWHGAGWTFLLFGMYHFVMIFLGNLSEPLIQKTFDKFKWNRDNKVYRVFRSIKASFFVVLGELIFRAPTVHAACGMLKKVFTDFSFSFAERRTLGIDGANYLVLFVALIVVFVISILKEKKIDVIEEINKKKTPVKWAILYLLIFAIIIFGAYGSGYQPVDPIYADF